MHAFINDLKDDYDASEIEKQASEIEKQREFKLPDEMYSVETAENNTLCLRPTPKEKQRESKLPVVAPREVELSNNRRKGNFEEGGVFQMEENYGGKLIVTDKLKAPQAATFELVDMSTNNIPSPPNFETFQ